MSACQLLAYALYVCMLLLVSIFISAWDLDVARFDKMGSSKASEREAGNSLAPRFFYVYLILPWESGDLKKYIVKWKTTDSKSFGLYCFCYLQVSVVGQLQNHCIYY